MVVLDTRKLPDKSQLAERSAASLLKEPWHDMSLGATVAQLAASKPDAEAVVDRKGRRRITFRELDRLTNQFANWLVAHDVLAGDVISMQLPNCLESVIVTIGANKAAVIVNPMLTVYREKELRYILAFSKAKVIFVPGFYRRFPFPEMARSVSNELNGSFKHVVVEVPDNDEDGASEWIKSLQSYSESPCGRHLDPSNVSVLLFTSGTESTPKGVMHSEQTLNSNVTSVWRALEMSEDDVAWMPSPVGHSSGFNYGIRFALIHGMKLVLQDRWDPASACALIEKERPAYTLAATVFLTDILKHARENNVNLSSVRVFGCGGAPIPPAVVNEATTHGMKVIRIYGQTEGLIVTHNLPSSPIDKQIDTDGCPIDGYSVEIIDEEGNILPVGMEGELVFSGPGVSLGYFNDERRTRDKFKNGWVYSGDVAIKDEDGYITIVGRKSEIIIRGGLNIAPREVEELVEQLEGVESVAVVGMPHERLGQVCCACIVPKPGASFDLGSVCSQLAERGLAVYKLPERLELMESLPTTASGKIQRHLIVSALLSVGTH